MFVAVPRSKRRSIVKVRRPERLANKQAREELATALENRLVELFESWADPDRLEALADEIETTATVDVVDGPLRFGELEGEVAATIEETFSEALDRGIEIGARFSGIEGVELDPDLITERAVLWMRTAGAEDISLINASSKDAVRSIVSELLGTEITPTDAAERIGRVVGLDARSAKALENYERRLLRRLIPTPEADTEDARATVADELERYRQRLLRRRGNLIADHESHTAIKQGERQFWEVANDQGLVDLGVAEKRWFTVRDGHPICEHCEPLHGVTVPADQEFVHTGFGGRSWGPPMHGYCYCYVEFAQNGF